MMQRVETYRYHSSSVGDISSVTIRNLALRLKAFDKAHDKEIKFRAAIAGAKLK